MMWRMNRQRLAGWIAAMTIGCSGCTPSNPVGEPRGPTQTAVDGSRSTGACDFDLLDTKAEAVFYVLGLLNDYNGRSVVEGGEEVEYLFCDEAPLVDEFKAALARLTREQGLRAPTTAQRGDCVTFFSSPELAARLNSCYLYDFADGQSVSSPSGVGRRRVSSGSLNFSLFFRDGEVDRARAHAYLAGAWRRWGHDGRFRFANSREKAEGTAMLLRRLGCSSVAVTHTVGTIPGAWTVSFTPTAEVSRWLDPQP